VALQVAVPARDRHERVTVGVGVGVGVVNVNESVPLKSAAGV
jgi:hypothetical protein